jgi:hypothetical protein
MSPVSKQVSNLSYFKKAPKAGIAKFRLTVGVLEGTMIEGQVGNEEGALEEGAVEISI